MKYIYIFFSLIAITGCQHSPFSGYSSMGDGIYYKLLAFGDSAKPAQPLDFITFDIAYRTTSDSLFFIGRRTMQLTEPEFNGSIDNCFLHLSELDSASFIIDAQDLFERTLNSTMPSFLNAGDKIKVDIKMIVIRNQEQYLREKEEFLAWIRDFGDYERTVLQNFIDEKKIEVAPTPSGMYFVRTQKGTGKKVELGDVITVNYEGKFLNGVFFDSSIKSKQPLEFVYGSEWQVIAGIDEAIGLMNEGDKALVILPSGLAWGDKGSSTGIIPPFTSIIYELELVSVKTRSIVN